MKTSDVSDESEDKPELDVKNGDEGNKTKSSPSEEDESGACVVAPSEEEGSSHQDVSGEIQEICDLQTSDTVTSLEAETSSALIRSSSALITEVTSSVTSSALITEVSSSVTELDLGPSINGETSGVEEEVEEAVEAGADMFWEEVEDRTQALAVPNTFKRQLTRPY